MDSVEPLFQTAIAEIERILNSKTVVGEPLEVQGHTIIPLVSVGFGFGVGSGQGGAEKQSEGQGGGAGGGGGIKPVAVLIAGPEGVRLEPIKGAAASFADKLGDLIGRAKSKSSD